MTIQRIVELLEIEHECILRNSHNDCDRNCADCDLVQDDGDLHEMYTDVIDLLKEREPLAVDEGKLNKCVCGNEINRYWHPEYCGFCGKKLEWY